MKKNLYVVLVGLAVLSGPMSAHAGLWDSITRFFSSEEEATEQVGDEAAAQKTEVKSVANEMGAKTEENSGTAGLMEQGMQYLPLLMQTLGISSEQATGGSGALMKAAQALLSESEFGTIAKSFPAMSSMLSSVPAPARAAADGAGGGLLDSAVKSAVDRHPTARAASDLVTQFASLGLGADMIPKFTEVTSGYLTKSGNTEGADLLSSALSKLLHPS